MFNEYLREIAPGYFYDRKAALEFVAEMPSDLFNAQVARAAFTLFGSADAYIRSKLSSVTAPVLLVQGRQDPAPEQSLLEAHQLLKGSQVKIIEKCGHFPWIEQPVATWKSVHTFLDPLTK